MRSKCRSRDVARPRQLAIYLAKKLTQASFPDIVRKSAPITHHRQHISSSLWMTATDAKR